MTQPLKWLPDGDVFFQAEDGIRDYKVTGVQTCALPISLAASPPTMSMCCWRWRRTGSPRCPRHSVRRRDRKSVVEGKSVDLGGRRIIKKKKLRGNAGIARLCSGLNSPTFSSYSFSVSNA